MTILDVIKTSGVRLTRGIRFVFWAHDTQQWEVYDKAVFAGRRVLPLVLTTASLEEAMAKLMEDEKTRRQDR